MRCCLAIVLFTLALCMHGSCDESDTADDFAEFVIEDEFVESSKVVRQQEATLNNGQNAGDVDDDEDDVVVQDDDLAATMEFDLFDDEEFEGYKETTPPPLFDQKTGEPTLTVAKVPLHFGTHWRSYMMEMVMIAGLLAYFGNYLIGRNQNSKLASLWLQTHRTMLEENFTKIGDDTNAERECPDGLIKESDSIYTLWCSGRTCCEGMLCELKLIRRQDLLSFVSDMMKKSEDKLHIKIELSPDVMDTFVFCLASKRTASKLAKEMYDVNKFCILVNNPEAKYNVPNGFSVLSEIPEASSAMLDSRVSAMLTKYGNLIDYIYVTDQYNGAIQQEEAGAQLKMPDVKRQLLIGFNLPRGIDMEATKPLMVLVFYLLEKVKRYRLSKEAKQKADKNRQRVEDEFMKSTHAARVEAAALRNLEKRKQEKERILAEEDPEKQRRWEKKEQKRQQKRNQPKMKQLSVKAM